MPSQPQLLTSDRLEHLLQERSEMAARPRPTPKQVIATWMENFGVGAGLGVAAAVVLYALRAPSAALLTGSVSVGLLTWAGMMAWRGSMDERSDWRNTRGVRRTVTAMRQEFDGQVRTLRRQLEAAFDEIETLERSLDRMTNERDNAIAELTRERQAAQAQGRSTFVAPRSIADQDVSDATEMVRFRYQSGQHPSKDKCNEQYKWSDDRWKAAQTVLVDARIIQVNKTQARWLSQSQDDALIQLGTYMLHARRMSVPAINATLGITIYPEDE